MSNRTLAHAALAVTAATFLGLAPATAQSALAQSASAQPATTQSATTAAQPAFGIAAPHSSANPLDHLGRPTPATQQRVRDFAHQKWIPQDVRNAILSALAFSTGEGTSGGPALIEGGPRFKQFYWPTVSGNCIGGSNDAVGSAIAVPGPTKVPAPGAQAGETVFLFTALGTPAANPEQGRMKVQWFNLNTLASGETRLHNHGINTDGPATISGTARTGKGTVIAVLSGAVAAGEHTCTFAPTAAIIEVK
ncbi:hypothetical protein [Corynebacterium lizhenjunii]|uniref:Rv1157c family protein n=1 Tax=Corynebacterium lizhenjunii TaxID=2709394 RepID=UPI0013ED7985|nr:hypothetical protein [Corynebacterium lizhenjunii]